ncbi:hypothetical protein QQP08_007790 [Theobroma cacao]|nr:hypothetical protein QQP08_007790 [Theobroma cacao]
MEGGSFFLLLVKQEMAEVVFYHPPTNCNLCSHHQRMQTPFTIEVMEENPLCQSMQRFTVVPRTDIPEIPSS